jgi:hypothetical protein
MTLVLALTVWVLISALATIGMSAVCQAGRMEDEALGYVPAPRSSSENVLEEVLV